MRFLLPAYQEALAFIRRRGLDFQIEDETLAPKFAHACD